MYKRTENRKPFCLFDAHDSRLQVNFLAYINNPAHKWVFSIGLPNGTHKWQVGDSKEQNGAYKVEWSREKAKLVLYKIRMGLSAEINKSDALPIVNLIWPRCFGRVRTNKKAIRDCEWFPANYRLLTDPEVLRTKSEVVSTVITTTPIVNTATTHDSPTATTATPIVNTATTHDSPTAITAIPIVNTPIVNAPSFTVGATSTVNTTIVPHSTLVLPSDDAPSATDKKPPLIKLSEVNFERGLAGEFAIDILQHIVRKDEVSNNLKTRYSDGEITRQRIDRTKRLTGGVMFKANHIVCDEEVLEIRREKEKEKTDKIKSTIDKAIAKFNEWKDQYTTLIASNVSETQYTTKNKKMIISFKKLKDDAAVPTKAAEIKARYETIKGRPVMTLKQYLTDRGLYNGSIVGDSDAEVESNMLELPADDLESDDDLVGRVEDV